MHPRMSDRMLLVLAEAAKRELFRVPILKPAAIVWTCRLGTVNQYAEPAMKRLYIVRHATVPTMPPRLEPRYRNRATGPVDVYRLTAAGWAAARRQLPREDTHKLLGSVPA
jgi:hypothetical protein